MKNTDLLYQIKLSSNNLVSATSSSWVRITSRTTPHDYMQSNRVMPVGLLER